MRLGPGGSNGSTVQIENPKYRAKKLSPWLFSAIVTYESKKSLLLSLSKPSDSWMLSSTSGCGKLS